MTQAALIGAGGIETHLPAERGSSAKVIDSAITFAYNEVRKGDDTLA